jgi:hypothetical protein
VGSAVAVGEGKFVLYSWIEPPLQAGDYRFTANLDLTATGHTPGRLPVAELPTYVTVRAPRYTLPPDQVLSTFPPAASEGAYGSRLPQVVIRRRTLPWERLVQTGVPRSTPWLALVLIAEGEAELKLNQPVAECVTPGKSLPGKADVELGNYLQIRKSMVDRIFPTRLDVPLLAHAREVDIHDTELMMGDDDGFLAVVIANRLPLPGRDAQGNAMPMKYLACLVNLEGQFNDLIERAPDPSPFTVIPSKAAQLHANLAQWDHSKMGLQPSGGDVDTGLDTNAGTNTDFGAGPELGGETSASTAQSFSTVTGVPNTGTAAVPSAQQATWSAQAKARSTADVYTEMAQDFSAPVVSGYIAGEFVQVDPALRFPVLLHWSFTSHGNTTFRTLVEGLDSGLLGTIPEEPDESGRPPLEVVETGHTGLAHRTRRGDEVRSWYRGPFVPHPTADPPGGRLPLAHAADQLRIVVPDGREDISLSAAFEIGRLLALARPSMIVALMRWRQHGYQTARRRALWTDHAPFVTAMLGQVGEIDALIGVRLGRGLVEAAVTRPQDFLGDPAPLVAAGRTLPVDESPEVVLAKGFGLSPEVLTGDPATVLGRLRDSTVLRPEQPALGSVSPQLRAVLAETLERELVGLVTDTLALTVDRRDALDSLLDGLEAGIEEER